MIPHAFEKKEDEASIISYDYEQTKEIKWYDKFLLNRPLKVILILMFSSIMAPLLIYHFVFYNNSERPPPDGYSTGSCLVSRASRIPCGYDNVTQSECNEQCCYDLHNNLCFHRVPSRFSYIVPGGREWTEDTDMTPRFATVPFDSQPSLPNIRLSVDERTSSHLSLTFYDPEIITITGARIEEKSYNYLVSSPELNVIVYADGSEPIFNTMRGPVIASDNIWEVTFKLSEQTMYGLGEIPLKPGTVKIIYSHVDDFSSVPLIFARRKDTFHGLMIDVTTPTEVSIRSDNQILVRSITKTGLKFHIFTGPKPEDIMREVRYLIQSKQNSTQSRLDYWMLGAHVCTEEGADDATALTNLNTFISDANRNRIPFESHCGLRPIVLEEGVATIPMANGARAVRNSRRRFVPHISPYIRYERVEEVVTTTEQVTAETTEGVTDVTEATEEPFVCPSIVCEFRDMMIRDPEESTRMYFGLADDHSAVYPDYSSENVTQLLDRLWGYDMVLDGTLLENSWPLDRTEKVHNETYETLPYFNEDFENAFENTPPWNARRPNGDYYLYDHNEYGNQFMDALLEKFDLPDIPTYSTSSRMRVDAVVNRQDIRTSWTNLRRELVAAALGGASGQWLWSTPICGDTDNFNMTTHASLCVKWYMAGQFLPLIKIHSKNVRRDPFAFKGTHQNLIFTTLTRRLSLLPYYHTVLQNGPLLRPMFYQYPSIEELMDLSTQFSVGDHLLIAPNLQPSQSRVHVWMPPGSWFEFWSGEKIASTAGQVVSLATTEADFVTLIRGGSIVPIQRVVRDTADLTRRNTDLVLVVATERVNITKQEDESEEVTVEAYYATGQIIMADNMTIFFEVQDNQLRITAEGDDFNPFCGGTVAVWTNMIRNVDIYGLPETLNNLDNRLSVNIMQGINMCNLRTQEIIVFTLY